MDFEFKGNPIVNWGRLSLWTFLAAQVMISIGCETFPSTETSQVKLRSSRSRIEPFDLGMM